MATSRRSKQPAQPQIQDGTVMPAAMSAADAQVAFGQLSEKIGGKADIFVSLAGAAEKLPLRATIYVGGMAARDERRVSASGVSFEDLLANLEGEWAKQKDAHRVEIVRKVALAIIRLTDSVGECSESMLRMEFGRADIEEYGAEAVARANEMAARGPFSIKTTAGANRPLEDA